MRIGIDARTILFPSTKDSVGIGHYTFQMIRHILEVDTENEYVIFFDVHTRDKDMERFASDRVKIVFYPFSRYMKFLPGMYNEIVTGAVIAKEKLDVLHVMSTAVRIPMSYRGKVITTCHDMGIYKCPENYKKVSVARAKAVTSLMVRKADHIIASSRVLKNDLVENFACDADAITTIYAGVDKRFYASVHKNERKVARRFGISKKYILFLGTVSPVKNITRLLHAFQVFKEKRRVKSARDEGDYQLLIVGRPGWLYGDITNFVSDLDLSRDVKFAGYVIGDEVVPLLHEAEFFVQPSLYEGLGMGIMEAFAAGAPVITSSAGSLGEIAGDAAYTVNPLDTHEIAAALEAFADSEELREAHKEKGAKRARNFSWEEAAKKTIAVYKSLAE